MPKENNKMQVDIDTLKKQNVNDLLSIKELYKRIEELGEKITQIKYIDNTLVKKLKKEYENLNKIILDENVQVKLTKDIETINKKLTNDIGTINSQMDNIENKTSDIIDIISYKLDNEKYINNAITRAIAQSNDGDTLFLKNGQFYIDNTINISKNINIKFIGDIIYDGSRDKEAINIFGMNYSDIFINRVIDKDSISAYNVGYHGWVDENYIGVKLENLKGCNIKINNIFNFTTGLCCCSSNGGGFWFNKITTNSFYNNKIQIMINSDGDGSWFNANEFYNGSFAYSGSDFKSDNIMRYTIKQTLTSGNKYGGNSNIFYNYKFEQANSDSFNCTQIYLEKALNWEFIDFRHEIINQNAKDNFCTLNLINSNKDQTNGCDISGIIFKPIGANDFDCKINLINYGKLNCELSKIYKINKDEIKKILVNETNILELARILKTNYNIIKKFKFATLNNTTIEGKYDCYSSTLKNNKNFTVPASFPLQIIINNISLYDEITIKCNSFEGNYNSVNIRGYDLNNKLVSGSEDENGQKIGLNGYWNSKINRYSYNVQNKSYTFTILDDSINKIEITIYGDIYDLFIESNNINNTVEFFDNFNVYTKPLTLLDGNWKVGDTVNHYDGALNEDIGWQLTWDTDNNQYTWYSIGKIID